MFFLLDNYDSFVYNLYAYFKELGQEIKINRIDEVSLFDIEKMNPEGIIISPGPGHPSKALLSLQIIDKFKEKIPILGVCLGHQAIGYYFGAEIKKGAKPMHGKISLLTNDGKALFKDFPRQINVTRYHSLIVHPEKIYSDFAINARSEDGAIMAISHKKYPIYGVQFHPEAIQTEHGHSLLNNFIEICKEWRINNENHRRTYGISTNR